MAIKNLCVAIVVEYLKHYNVRRIVLSPGMRNIPLVTAVEEDSSFDCYSVVDERNAAFFALGMAQQTGDAVALVCTSGTAVSNYLPGITEAYYSHVPLVAITCDRSPYSLGQLETQKIDQIAALSSSVKMSCSLPVIKDRDDVWYFERILNEALIAAVLKRLPGPVHINLPIVGDTNVLLNGEEFSCCVQRRKFIDYVALTDADGWKRKSARLRSAKRVLVIMGQSISSSSRLKASLSAFCRRLGCPVLSDNLSNFRCKQSVASEAVIKGLSVKSFAEVLPEIVITLGLNFQERIKDLLKAYQGRFDHWSIDAEGVVRDCFKSETAVFECLPEEFFERMEGAIGKSSGKCRAYHQKWARLATAAMLPELPYGNFRAVMEFCRLVPKKAIVHLSILNSTRLAQFFKLPHSVSVFSNVNAFGIDGCLPTFMGQACSTTRPAFLVIGDISFFYAMNALSIKHRRRNIHILLINNGGAAEFHIPPASNAMPTIDNCIGVSHNRSAKEWAESQGYVYLNARDNDGLETCMREFVRTDNALPVLFEVFTNMKSDGEFCLSVYRHLEECLNNSVEFV